MTSKKVEKQATFEEECDVQEKIIAKRMKQPMILARYQYGIQEIMAKLQYINADLTEQLGRPVVRNTLSRIKTAHSICKKLERKELELSFDSAVNNLNDIAGVRVVCFFCDDIYRIEKAIHEQKDIEIIKEKDYVKKPKKSGYQSIHLIVDVPIIYNSVTENVRVEIQIRSFAMDYWAELDNQMCYKKSAGELENIEREIRNYSDVMAKMDGKMLELRKKIEAMTN